MEECKAIENANRERHWLEEVVDLLRTTKALWAKIGLILMLVGYCAYLLTACAAEAKCTHTLEIDGKHYEFGTSYDAQTKKSNQK